MNKRIEIFELLIGIVFLISGFAKAFDISGFGDIISQYVPGSLSLLSVPIVLTEIILGLMLILKIGERLASLTACFLVVFFTLVYSYGLMFKGVEDCGCFGDIKFLNTSPVLLYIRNVVLICLSIDIYMHSENRCDANKLTVIIIIVVMCIAAFMSGYTARNLFKKQEPEAFKEYSVEDSPLKDFVSFSNDSTYLIFVFTYSCPHCMNSIENLKQYEDSGVVDKVIALAMNDDTIAKKHFQNIFHPQFTIRDYPKNDLLKLTTRFPKTYYVRHNMVIASFSGELPCSMVFKSAFENK